jgi:hypothetical protein
VLAVVQRPSAVGKLQTFYNPTGGFAGLSFLDLYPAGPCTIGPGDLMAPSLMSAPLTPKQARSLVAVKSQVGKALRAIPLGDQLATASPTQLAGPAMCLYTIVSSALDTGERNAKAWVKADKICARKRAGLFPIRDR